MDGFANAIVVVSVIVVIGTSLMIAFVLNDTDDFDGKFVNVAAISAIEVFGRVSVFAAVVGDAIIFVVDEINVDSSENDFVEVIVVFEIITKDPALVLTEAIAVRVIVVLVLVVAAYALLTEVVVAV